MLQQLTLSEYRLLVENSPVLIWRAGLDAKCDYFNDPWLAFTGRTMEQETGDGWAEGVHRGDFDRCVAFYLDHFKRRQPFEMEYRLRRHDGVFRWIFDRGVPFADESGEFAGYIGSCVDVDERRKAQDATAEYAQEELAQARNFEKWILAIVSHDIRNPLHTIQLATVGLQHIADPAGVAKKCAELVNRGVSRITNIVGDLLDLSRERDGAGISLSRKTVDLRAVCQQVIDELLPIAGARGITFVCDADVRGEWDEQRMFQVISNLVSNAVKHGSPGTPVRVRLTGYTERVTVEVHNEGSIPADMLPRIFEPFRSVGLNVNRGDGLGLGLFIARSIAQAHEGTLEVITPQGATIFRLVLPRHTASASLKVSG